MNDPQPAKPTDTASSVPASASPIAEHDDELERLLAAAPFGLIGVDAKHCLTGANARALDLLGFATNNVAGHPLVDSLADPGESPLIDDALREAGAGSTVRRSLQVRAAGVLRGVDLQFWPYDGAATSTTSVLVMIDSSTAKAQARQIGSLIARSPQGMARLVDDLSMTNMNSRWTEITGQTIADATGRGWLDRVDVDGRDDFVTALTEALDARQGLKGRLRVRTTNGESRWIDITATPLDQQAHCLLTFDDTTEEFDTARRADELSRALEATTDLVGILSADGRVLRWMNEALTAVLSPAALDRIFAASLDADSALAFAQVGLPAVSEAGSWRGELNLRTATGSTVPVSAMLVPHLDGEGTVDAISVVARDISELRSAQAQAADTEMRMAALVENASDLVALVEPSGTVLYASPAVERFLERGPGSLDGKDALEIVHPDDLARAHELAANVAGPGAPPSTDENPNIQTAVLRVTHADGSYRTLEVTAKDLTHNPAVGGVVVNATDITASVVAAEQLESRAYHDDLTGLPNRALLIDCLSDALNQARDKKMMVGLLSLDLDRFNVVNESLGHHAGDEMLSEVGARIDKVIRPGDMVARLGGDEFAVIIPDMLRPGDAVNAARRLRKALTQPIRIGNESAVITTSIGIAMSNGTDAPEDLLRDADTALHRAKTKGRDLAVVFDDNLRDQAVRRLEVENKLRRAISEDALEVHYQPVLEAGSGRLAGSEALVRIKNDDGSLVMPGSFIDVAEDSGLITDLGHQVLVKAIHQTAEWTRQQVSGQQPLSIAVNVSARQLTDPHYADNLRQELETAGLDAEQLSIELTESALIEGNPTTELSMQNLRNLGVRIGLDDFGTGFSSLAYLKRFPISFLKVDRSFVDGLGKNENDSAIVRATIALAKGLNLKVVAEGVETEEQLAQLAALDCDLVQGYLFSKPVGPEQFSSYLGMRWKSTTS